MKPNNRSTWLALALIAASAGLGACGNNNASIPPLQIPPPPPPPPPVVFSEFVKQQIAATADDTDPEPVDGTDFAFDDEENPGAFDDVLAP